MSKGKQSRIPWCATFVQEHMNDRFFDIGGHSKSGWVMQWCMDKLDSIEEIPMSWKPAETRERKADEYAWQNNACGSDWPNQD